MFLLLFLFVFVHLVFVVFYRVLSSAFDINLDKHNVSQRSFFIITLGSITSVIHKSYLLA